MNKPCSAAQATHPPGRGSTRAAGLPRQTARGHGGGQQPADTRATRRGCSGPGPVRLRAVDPPTPANSLPLPVLSSRRLLQAHATCEGALADKAGSGLSRSVQSRRHLVLRQAVADARARGGGGRPPAVHRDRPRVYLTWADRRCAFAGERPGEGDEANRARAGSAGPRAGTLSGVPA